MRNVYKDNKVKVITPYGLTKKVNVDRGVRQGCPISPLMFIMCIEACLNWIKDTCKGYKIANSMIPALAFCDDIALIATNNNDLQYTVDKLNKFLNHYGLKLGIDAERTKTVYTHNEENKAYKLTYQTDSAITIPQMKPSEWYKYLGVWISLDLNWNKQMIVSKTQLKNQIKHLQRKCFTVKQCVDIANIVLSTPIDYRLNIIDMPKQWKTTIEREISRFIYRKLGVRSEGSAMHLQHPFEEASFNVKSTHDSNILGRIRTILNQFINGDDQYAKDIWEFNISNAEVPYTQLKHQMKQIELDIEHNTNACDDGDQLIHHFADPTSIAIYNARGPMTLADVITPEGTVKSPSQSKKDKFPGTINAMNLNAMKAHQRLTSALTEPFTHEIKAEIKQIMSPPMITPLASNHHYNKQEELMVWIDGSFIKSKNKAAYAIAFAESHPNNTSGAVFEEQTNNNAELQALIWALTAIPPNTKIAVYTDSMLVVNTINNIRTNSHNQMQYQNLTKKIKEQYEQIQQQQGTLNCYHVFSHLLEKKKWRGKKQKQYKERMNTMTERYKDETRLILKMNQVVDRLAQEATRKQQIAKPVACKYQPKFVLKSKDSRTLQPISVHVKKALSKRRTTKYAKEYPTHKVSSPRVDKSVTKQIFSKTIPAYAAAQNYLFKIRYHRLRSKVNVIRDANKSRNPVNLSEHYSDNKCPMCRTSEDTTNHHVKCPVTKNIAKQLPRQILRIVNKYLLKNKHKRIHFFPAWYWLHDPGAPVDPTLSLANGEMEMAQMPQQIKRKLQQIGIKSEDNMKCRTEMQLAVTQNFHKRWLFRCQFMHSKYRNRNQPVPTNI